MPIPAREYGLESTLKPIPTPLLSTFFAVSYTRKRGFETKKRSVSAKGRTARLSKWQDVHPYVREYCSSDLTPHWQMCINLARSAKNAWALHRSESSCTKTKDIG